jgi:Fe-S-cluster containining protein
LELFNCTKCGQCCYGRGGIWLNDFGRREAAEYLGLRELEFSQKYLTFDKGLWSVGTDAKGYCLLFQKSGCLIHRVKPIMCRLWPFFYGPLNDEAVFLEVKDTCPGLSDWDWARFLRARPPQMMAPKSFRAYLLEGI